MPSTKRLRIELAGGCRQYADGLISLYRKVLRGGTALAGVGLDLAVPSVRIRGTNLQMATDPVRGNAAYCSAFIGRLLDTSRVDGVPSRRSGIETSTRSPFSRSTASQVARSRGSEGRKA
jgi:hypothetical protein